MGSASPSPSRSGNPPSPIAKGGFPLAGVSNPPDPAFYAYRQDLADVALAGLVIASHYAEPLLRHLVASAPFLAEPDDRADLIAALKPGDELLMLDDTRGWAWGYAGPERRVGYVRADAVGV